MYFNPNFVSHKLVSLNNSYSEIFIIECVTRFRNNTCNFSNPAINGCYIKFFFIIKIKILSEIIK